MTTVTVRVSGKIIEDHTGITSEIPLLVTAEGELSALTDYLLYLQANGRSKSTLEKVVRAVAIFLSFMEANADSFSDPKKMFQTFVRRLYSGTVSDSGLDPSALFWVPASVSTVREHINTLTAFTDWLADTRGAEPLNPLRRASRFEERLAYAAWYRRNQNDFLGHLKDESFSNTVKRARNLKGRTPLIKTEDDAIAFPTTKFEVFFNDGIGAANDPRVALRDKLVLLLMHGAGLRVSEALVLWVTDVFEDPQDPSRALVRIYNEHQGVAPDGWKSRNNERSRRAYLKVKYGRVPRCEMTRPQNLGWKARLVDHKEGYLVAHWFPTEIASLFMVLWKTYLRYRAAVDAFHPYAFISFESRNFGNPYTTNAFNQNYSAGLRRIGLQPNKAEGLSPHGHRHNYGRRLTDAGIDPLIRKKCLHHKSLASQTIYTLPSARRVSEMLSAASEQLNNSDPQMNKMDWKSLVEHDFDVLYQEGMPGDEHEVSRCRK